MARLRPAKVRLRPWTEASHVSGTSSNNGLDLASGIECFKRRSGVQVRRERRGRLIIFNLDDELLELMTVDERVARMTLAVRPDRASVRPEEVLREVFGEWRAPAQL